MSKRLFSELSYYKARKKSGKLELDLLIKSLQQQGTNVKSSARWLNRADRSELVDNLPTTEAALANTLFLGLRKLRDAKTNSGKDDFLFEQFVIKNASRSISQIFQDLWVLFETKEKKSGFFVEFGATNGTDISNSLLLEKAYGWDGILAEPNPFWHKKLQDNRTANIETKCLSSRSGDTLELLLTEDPEFASTIHRDDIGAKLLPVETISLSDMLEKHKAPETIDFLSIDTEGSELEILEAYDFRNAPKIKLIAVEHNFEATKRDGLHQLLSSKGYKRKYKAYSMFDDWYVLQD